MRSQRVEHIPDVFEGRLVEHLVRIVVVGEEHGQDDGAERLVRCPADRPADSLDDVDGRTARVDECHAVDARHVHSFAEAASIAEQPALVRREIAEPQQ